MKTRHLSYYMLTALSACALLCTAPASLQTDAKEALSQGIYEIKSAADTDYVLDIRYCTFTETDSHTPQLYHALDINQQKFYLEELAGGAYRISAMHTGEVLSSQAADSGEVIDTADAVSEDSGSDTAEEDSGSDESEKHLVSAPVYTESLERTSVNAARRVHSWTLKDAGDGTYYICSRSGKYLTADGSKAYLGTPVVLQNFSGKENQKWILEESWITAEDTADTDLVNPYTEGGASDNLTIKLSFGNIVETLSNETLASWTIETEDHQFQLDTTQLTAYAESLAEEYNTYGHPRTFVTTGGSEITLYKGSYGWKLDTEATANALAEAATQSGRVKVSPVWEQEGAVLERGNDIGDSYVEVSLTEQKVWLYINGEQILATDCVSGTYGTDRQTPGGVYRIYYRQSPAVLRGADYESPVEYWMAYNGGIGLHDANWRSTFGGDIFKTNGSHGCVNLPTDAAKLIYEMTEIGFPVVSYN